MTTLRKLTRALAWLLVAPLVLVLYVLFAFVAFVVAFLDMGEVDRAEAYDARVREQAMRQFNGRAAGAR